MAASMNRVTLLGNMGKDPEIRTMSSGDKVASFSLATSESWKDKASGDWKEKTQWHNVVIWNEHLVRKAESLKKGTTILIEGALETRKYNKDGNDVYVTEVVLKKFKGELLVVSKKEGGGRDDDYGGSTSYEPAGGGRARYDDNDDIPF